MTKKRPIENIGIGFAMLMLLYFLYRQEIMLWIIFFLSVFGVIVYIIKKIRDRKKK